MSAAAQISPASPLLAAELWTSFASLLRSHVAMHTVARPNGQLRISSGSGSVIEILGLRGRLNILQPNTAGTGTIEFRSEPVEREDEYSVFFFTQDGLLYFENLNDVKDLEAAVEYLLGKVQA